MQLNINDLIHTIDADDGVNFLAMAITPLHVAGVDAGISYLTAKGIDLKGYILIAGHPFTGRTISESDFQTANSNIRYVDFGYRFAPSLSVKKKLSYKVETIKYCQKTSGIDFYIMWTEVFNNLFYIPEKVKRKYNIHFLQIDDGAASYMSDFKLRLSYLRFASSDSIFNNIKFYIKAYNYAFFSKKYRIKLLDSKKYTWGTIFLRNIYNNYRFERNTDFLEHYIKAFQRNIEPASPIKKYEDAIVINTQCLEEGGITDGIVDYNLYAELAGVLAKHSCRVVLKPHPREKSANKYIKLNWEIIKTSMSQEAILASIEKEPKCVISIYSSTLLNAYGLFEIPVISLAKIMLQRNIRDVLRNELEQYIDTYRDIILFPENMGEVDRILKKIIHRQ